MDFNTLLQTKEHIIFDGAMGTQLQQAGLRSGEIPELLNIYAPETVIKVHESYLEAGSDIISSNTFGANSLKLTGCGSSVAEIIKSGVDNAKKAISQSGKDALCALDIGPLGKLLEPVGELKFETAYELFKEQMTAGQDADVIIIETMTDLYELKAALLAAKESTALPVICSMTFEESGKTFTGCDVISEILLCEGLGASAVGVNCSLGPKELIPIVKQLSENSRLPVIVQANAGLPDPVTGGYSVTSDEFARYSRTFAELGAKIIGGCCGTSPEFIKKTAAELSGMKYTERKTARDCTVCSGTSFCRISEPRIVGERINPTGKKLFKAALIENDIDYILNQASAQVSAGADILDINVGLPEINEMDMMVRVVKAVQSITDVPLQIDSTVPSVIEAALRIYNGKPIVNSVNGERKSLETILPIVKKYGAAVVGLTLDENGIPQEARQRLAIAEKIVKAATDIGIPCEDIIIDCLTLTASAEQKAVRETLESVRLVKEKLGVKTILGISNISFGLPARETVNAAFLTMALENGLDLAIINPNIESMTGSVRAYKLLCGIDENSADYIACYSSAKNTAAEKADKSLSLEAAIVNGLKGEAARITENLLETTEPMQIVNEMLIPALDKVGNDFESGKLFLPQLIMAANAAQGGFEAIKRRLCASGVKQQSKGKVVLATVKGDIHDIGKNIVKILLENYGYEVIDLGKDVPCEKVVEAVKSSGAKLCGLSALMTTTLPSMEKTVRLLKESGVNCKTVVGGAVLTPDYAKRIGADYYAKDAKQTVDVAASVYGQ